jgi:hypothetical protein
MPLSNRRNRLVSFRLTDPEYRDVAAASEKAGARSISEFARSLVTMVVNSDPDKRPTGRENIDFLHLRLSVQALQAQVDELTSQRKQNAAAASGATRELKCD